MSKKLNFIIDGHIVQVDDINLDNICFKTIPEENFQEPPSKRMFVLPSAQSSEEPVQHQVQHQVQAVQAEQQPSNKYGLTDSDYEKIVEDVNLFDKNPLINNEKLYISLLLDLYRKGYFHITNMKNIDKFYQLMPLYDHTLHKWKHIYTNYPYIFDANKAKYELNGIIFMIYKYLM